MGQCEKVISLTVRTGKGKPWFKQHDRRCSFKAKFHIAGINVCGVHAYHMKVSG